MFLLSVIIHFFFTKKRSKLLRENMKNKAKQNIYLHGMNIIGSNSANSIVCFGFYLCCWSTQVNHIYFVIIYEIEMRQLNATKSLHFLWKMRNICWEQQKITIKNPKIDKNTCNMILKTTHNDIVSCYSQNVTRSWNSQWT